MQSLVIYDSNFGNTKNIADVIASKLDAQCTSTTAVTEAMIAAAELIVVGAPINAWRPAPRMVSFLSALRPDQLSGKKIAAFDTRVRLFIHGDAAGKIDRALTDAGGTSVASPTGFIVEGREGPLANGEMQRAAAWGLSLAAS